MWGLPGSGIEPVSPALAGGFFTTESPGKKLLRRNWRAAPPLATREKPAQQRRPSTAKNNF